MTDFNNIPQEKFDNMEKAMENSNQKAIKNLKVNYIDIQNFKNIDYITTELSDWNVVGGYNGNGKSSFLDAILTAIQSNKFYGKGAVTPASLVQKWENKATIKLLIKWEETEITIERIFKAGTPKKPAWSTELVAEMNGKKISQASLDELLNALTLDPLKLGSLTQTEQIQEIKKTVWLDTDQIDKQIKDQEESRKEARSYKDRATAVFDELTASGVPEETKEASLEKLFEAKNEYMNIWTLQNNKERKLDQYKSKKSEIEELEKKLEQAKQDLETIKEEWKQIEESIKSKESELNEKYGSLENIDKQIEEVEETNKKAQAYNKYLEAKKSKDEAQASFKEEEEKLEQLRKDRTEIIASSNLPEYMSISDDFGILVDGIEYKLLNTARKIEVAIDLVLISGSPLRMIRIENGWELDVKTLEKIKDKILDNNFQIFIERPTIDKFDSIIISDWEIVDDKEDFINNQ